MLFRSWGNALLGYSRTLDLRAATGQTTGPSEVYVNETYGFSLTLPESWARSGAVAETGPDSALFYDPALVEEAGAVATLGVWTAFPAAITGEPYLLEGSREGRYVYLEFRDPGGADAPEYQTLYEDLQALPGQYLTGETETASGGEIQTWKDLARREQEEQDRILGWYQGCPRRTRCSGPFRRRSWRRRATGRRRG